MSANNWTKCPRCLKRHEAHIEALQTKADEAYGNVPLDEWKEMDAATAKARLTETPNSMREDWEIGTNEEGRFEVTYGASCRTCGLDFHFNDTEQMEGLDG